MLCIGVFLAIEGTNEGLDLPNGYMYLRNAGSNVLFHGYFSVQVSVLSV